MSIPTFKRFGEHWDECHICGFGHPHSRMRKHYKSKKLVCHLCDDQLAHSDYMEQLKLGPENRHFTEQRIHDQGALGPFEIGHGAGERGAGEEGTGDFDENPISIGAGEGGAGSGGAGG